MSCKHDNLTLDEIQALDFHYRYTCDDCGENIKFHLTKDKESIDKHEKSKKKLVKVILEYSDGTRKVTTM